MAAATYITDLNTINILDSNSTPFAVGEPTGSTAGTTIATETDHFVVGTACVSKIFNATGVGGLGFSATPQVLPADGAFYMWTNFLAANAINTTANGGMQLLVGNTAANYRRYYIYGDDTVEYGGWQVNAIDPDTVGPSANQGSPNGTWQYFGIAVNVTAAVARGYPLCWDAVRVGRGSIIMEGGDLANGYATFDAAAEVNDTNTVGAENRWGIFSYANGTYTLQGRLAFGNSLAVDFRDSNRIIFIKSTPFVSTNFNTFEITNVSSRVDWTNITINSLTTTSPGRVLVSNNADFNVQGCVFSDLGTFSFLSNSSIDDTTFRRCGQITTGGCSFTNNFVRNSTAASSVSTTFSNFSTITGNDFLSDGSNHAITVASSAGTTNITWNNTLSGYVTGTAGTNVGTTSGTGNEAIYITGTATSTVNITVAAGATIPSIRKDSANVTVNITANQLTFTISGIQSGTELRVYTYTNVNDPTTYTEFAGAEVVGASPSGSTFTSITASGSTFTATKTYDGGTAIPVLIVAHNLNYQFFRQTTTLSSSENTSFTIFQISDRNYDEGATPYVL